MKRRNTFVSVLLSIVYVLSVMLSSCDNEHSADHVEIYGKSIYSSDNIYINLPEGYFLVEYDKNRIDDAHLDLVLHFSSNDTWNGQD